MYHVYVHHINYLQTCIRLYCIRDFSQMRLGTDPVTETAMYLREPFWICIVNTEPNSVDRWSVLQAVHDLQWRASSWWSGSRMTCFPRRAAQSLPHRSHRCETRNNYWIDYHIHAHTEIRACMYTCMSVSYRSIQIHPKMWWKKLEDQDVCAIPLSQNRSKTVIEL